MSRYGSDFRLDASSHSFDVSQFGNVEWAGILAAIAQTERVQIFNVGVGGSFYSYPQLGDGVIYIGCTDRNFYAIEAATGKEVWRFTTEGQICGSARIVDDALYFGSYDGNLYSLHLNGRLRWKFPTNAKIYSTPAFANGLIIFGNEDGRIFALHQDGTVAWEAKAIDAIGAHPLAFGELVLVPSFDRNLYALDAETGKQRWRFQGKAMMGSPTVADGTIYVPNYDGNLYALNRDGTLKWRFPIEQQAQNTPPTIWNDTVYFIARQNVLYAVSTAGQLRWKFSTASVNFIPVTIDRGVLYFGTSDGQFFALDARTGRTRWKKSYSLGINSQPVIADDVIIFGSSNCKVHALTLEGNAAWEFPASISTPAPVDVEPPSRMWQEQPVFEVEEPVREEKDRYRSEGGVADQFGPKSTYVIKSQYTEKSTYGGKRRE